MLPNCSLQRSDPKSANLTFNIQNSATKSYALSLFDQTLTPGFESFTAPSSTGGFGCIAVNVTGQGIGDVTDLYEGPNTAEYIDAVVNGTPCTYEGATSKWIPNASGSSVSVEVPLGSQRLVQVLGYSGTEITCPSSDPAGKVIDVLEGAGISIMTNMYELGRAFVDVFQDATVGISAQYTAGNATQKGFSQCHSGEEEGGAGLSLELLAGRYGTSSSGFDLAFSTGNANLIDWGAPAEQGIGSALSAQQVQDLMNGAGAVAIGPGVTGYLGRMDLLFDNAPRDISKSCGRIVDRFKRRPLDSAMHLA